MLFDMPTCGACRTCEIACSFHHTGEFRPSISSIKVLDKANGKGHSISLVEKDDGQSIVCDGCLDLEEPLCVEYCKEKEELGKIIKEFLEKVKAKRSEYVKC